MTEAAARPRLTADQLIVLASLVAVAALAWLYLLGLVAAPAHGAQGMGGMAMGEPASPAAPPFLTAVMWMVMMVGMMLPSAAPMIVIHAGAQRGRSGLARLARSGLFVAGYLLVWAGFSIVATAAQLQLMRLAWLSPAMTLASGRAAGLVLLGVGVYELTPLKRACLAHCQGPVGFVSRHWRPGDLGALRMGIEHGLYCLGCCWALMLALFAGGVMNLLWVAALAVVVLAQKLLPAGRWTTYATAVAFVGAGILVMLGVAPGWLRG